MLHQGIFLNYLGTKVAKGQRTCTACVAYCAHKGEKWKYNGESEDKTDEGNYLSNVTSEPTGGSHDKKAIEKKAEFWFFFLKRKSKSINKRSNKTQ